MCVHGTLEASLCRTLEQFVEWSSFAPASLWPSRRREIIQLIHHLGYDSIGQLASPPTLGYRVYELLKQNMETDLSVIELAGVLAMSDSTLRRKLAVEGTSVQEIKDRTRLGYGLHLIQTTMQPVGLIAERCGYASSSRFTERFKSLFGITPSDLRKTRLPDQGERLPEQALIFSHLSE